MHISEYTTEQLYAALVHRAKSIMSDAGITVDDLEMNHIINHTHVRNAKIRAEYHEQIAAGVKGEAVKMNLAENFGLGYNTIKSIVQRIR